MSKEEQIELEEKVLELDQDTAIEDEGDGSIYPYDPEFGDIDISDTPFSVFEYLRKLENGRITIQPDFQRHQVWKLNQKSRFIESILLNFPLPPIYLNETVESNYIVIDGLQRTTSLYEFYKGKYALSGLEALPKYNNYYFNDLPAYLQSKFEDKKLTVFNLKPSTPMVVVYDLFNRINTGGTQLNRQEVRNCIFIGKSTELLKHLSEQDYFKRAIDWGVKDTRMKDREVILRYLAFRWFDYQTRYVGDMSGYVESAMKKINRMEDKHISTIEKDFERVMKWTFKIWEKANFRIPTDYTRGTINTAIFETVGCYISEKTDEFLEHNTLIIKENYSQLIKDTEYYDAVSRATGGKSKVMLRFELVHKILNSGTHA
ncbi:DUF262 domain-containing protein [Flammeovirga sp. SJP92]|uniref:DUF262 domain-containing protein n=1 Tax=Flammeovirga sp. SJP92 TaxID=1775430 RepID=UPI000786DBCE|nr:DUF262 domain-containing protein [Flammeovirga sp. SJP92]KXX69449.1 hypothetical protein AVL50_19040 [Flammeovirga sp. SJP92]